jgi:DNA-binding transcriptional LysR family regulator
MLIDMDRLLDIAPLRSLVAVSDCGGFLRAAAVLHLSQGAVSQHVRRLESAVGRPLVERHGRGSRFTADGEQLLIHARRILAQHDEALRGFGAEYEQTLVIGSTEHAAAQLLPHLVGQLERVLPSYRFRLRVDRGTRLRDALEAGSIDLALLLGAADGPRATLVGEIELDWFSAPGWARPPPDEPVPVVAFDDPCVLRSRALETLSLHGVPSTIGAEAIQLAGVQAAVAAGQGVALLATLGQVPGGLIVRDDLPEAEPLLLSVWSRQGLAVEIAGHAAGALRQVLASGFARPHCVHDPTLAQGA